MNKLIFYSFLFLILSTNVFSNTIKIISKVNQEVITNYDIQQEINYLKFLNPGLKEVVDKKKIFNLGKSSITKEIIKKKELENFLDLNKDYGILEKIENDLISKKKLKNKEQLKQLITNADLNYDEIFVKLKIEAMWNELIYTKFQDSVKINESYLLERLREQKKNLKIRYNYFLNEILFEVSQKENLDEKLNLIKSSIKNIGFKNTANTYSISDSSKYGGEIGWIKQTQLSDVILDKIINLEINETSEVIQSPAGFLVLMISEKEKIIEPFDEKKNLSLMKNFEANRQLNQFSLIYYKRLKKNAQIQEYR